MYYIYVITTKHGNNINIGNANMVANQENIAIAEESQPITQSPKSNNVINIKKIAALISDITPVAGCAIQATTQMLQEAREIEADIRLLQEATECLEEGSGCLELISRSCSAYMSGMLECIPPLHSPCELLDTCCEFLGALFSGCGDCDIG